MSALVGSIGMVADIGPVEVRKPRTRKLKAATLPSRNNGNRKADKVVALILAATLTAIGASYLLPPVPPPINYPFLWAFPAVDDQYISPYYTDFPGTGRGWLLLGATATRTGISLNSSVWFYDAYCDLFRFNTSGLPAKYYFKNATLRLNIIDYGLVEYEKYEPYAPWNISVYEIESQWNATNTTWYNLPLINHTAVARAGYSGAQGQPGILNITLPRLSLWGWFVAIVAPWEFPSVGISVPAILASPRSIGFWIGSVDPPWAMIGGGWSPTYDPAILYVGFLSTIPEFQDVLVPIVGVAIVVLILRRKKK